MNDQKDQQGKAMTITAPETTAEWVAEIKTSVNEFFKTAFQEVRDTDEDHAVLRQAMNFVAVDELVVMHGRTPDVLFVKVKNRLGDALAEIFQDRTEHYWENRFTEEGEAKVRGKLGNIQGDNYEDFQERFRESVEWANWTGQPIH